jgi:hypothetical protein
MYVYMSVLLLLALMRVLWNGRILSFVGCRGAILGFGVVEGCLLVVVRSRYRSFK